MCEIFCFNSNTPKQVNECLECFYNHSEDHPHGWGLANMQSNEFVIDKEPMKASCSEHLKNILSNPVIGKNVFAHIRLATMGEIISPNCHPFTEADDNNRSWMLIHNGTIFDYPKLNDYIKKEKGNTDSERILLYIIDKVNEFERDKGRLSTIKERFNLLTDIVADLSKNNKLNLMFYDGDLTYIHSNMRDSLYYLKDDESFLVASTPLTDDENWKPVELNKLFGLIDGNIIFESEEHENEFILTEEHEKAIEGFLKSINRDDIND
ncbi:class II glutamine amidotransferase [uncultured Methanobrevibacter sp.]|uniref:class II glutamine amidotransferase n=1 Tax=uncultured Methanobrevibacter sp. TaxID=253161 RepID=UPI0025D6BA2C|nr:class II glutamine amidotransferase [uncultured Methanobrevibacter sp.]